MGIQFFFKKTGFFLLSIYNQDMGFLSEVFMLTEFGNWIEQGLTWVIEHFDEPLWNITIVILLGVGLFFYHYYRVSAVTSFSLQVYVKCGLDVQQREIL